MVKLILVRHGETDKNAGNSMHSIDDSEGLNEKGKEQIIKTADKLKEYRPKILFSSTERRAIDSAELISSILKIPRQTIEGMQERNWGTFSGKSWDQVKKVLDPMTLEERYNFTPPEGESWATFETRLIKAVKNVLSENTENIAIVAHGGAIRALMPFLLNKPKEESFKYDPDNASLTIFDYDGKNFSTLAINDTSHLYAD